MISISIPYVHIRVIQFIYAQDIVLQPLCRIVLYKGKVTLEQMMMVMKIFLGYGIGPLNRC